METLLDRNKLTPHFLVKPNSQSELYKSNSNQPHLAALPMTYSCSESSWTTSNPPLRSVRGIMTGRDDRYQNKRHGRGQKLRSNCMDIHCKQWRTSSTSNVCSPQIKITVYQSFPTSIRRRRSGTACAVSWVGRERTPEHQVVSTCQWSKKSYYLARRHGWWPYEFSS